MRVTPHPFLASTVTLHFTSTGPATSRNTIQSSTCLTPLFPAGSNESALLRSRPDTATPPQDRSGGYQSLVGHDEPE
jgi:hypothetical protein